jgi:hypothetical protein
MIVALARKLLIALWRFDHARRCSRGHNNDARLMIGSMDLARGAQVVTPDHTDPRGRRVFGVGVVPRLHRVVPPSLGLSRPECGTMVGIQSRRM